jgi:hypothetical protein
MPVHQTTRPTERRRKTETRRRDLEEALEQQGIRKRRRNRRNRDATSQNDRGSGP